MGVGGWGGGSPTDLKGVRRRGVGCEVDGGGGGRGES